MRQQLGESLPGTMSIFARGLGVSTQSFDKMLRSGGLTATDVLLPVSAQLKAETASSATNAGDSTGASFNRFNNSVKELQVNFGATLLPAIKIAMNGLADAIALVSDNGWNLVKAFAAIFATGFKLLHIPLQRIFQELQNLSVEQSSISAKKSTLTSLDRDELQKLAKREQEIVERQAELSIKTGAVQSGIQSAVDFSTQLYSDPRFIDQRPQIESTLKMALAAQRELNDFLRGVFKTRW
ncbi:MAG: tape measure protein [Crinalium sp.]